MDTAKFKVFANILLLAGSLLALANAPANAELLIGISFASQGGDGDIVGSDKTLLMLPKTKPKSQLQGPLLLPVQTPIQTIRLQPAPAKKSASNLDLTYTPFTRASSSLWFSHPEHEVGAKNTANSSAASDPSISHSVSVTVLQPVDGVLTATFNQSTLQLDWPANHIGWILQTRTNSPGDPINPKWFPVSGSSATNHVDLTLDRANTSVFFRIVAP
jgi:hypothetical protein